MPQNKFMPFQNPAIPIKTRITDLLDRLSVREKFALMLHRSPAIRHLNVPEYNWWNEALHGVARAGIATVFPQPIGLAATFDPSLIQRVATVISDEARAKHHEAVRQGDRGIYKGLTFWSPNVNLYRDPRWGRGHETYGEDPWLSGRMGVAFVQGLQGDDPNLLKSVATPKHFAVHSGPEAGRHSFNAEVSEQDLRESYLPAFRATVVEGGAEGVMGAYNRVNGEPCCANPRLLGDILRGEWGFSGHVVSDCGALSDFHEYHGITKNAVESAALALNNGCELNCGFTFVHLMEAYEQGLISDEAVDRAARRVLQARFKLGLFDGTSDSADSAESESHPYTQIPYEVVACKEHRELALQSARESLVLLKNSNNVLPLALPCNGYIAVIGPNAHNHKVLLGNYNGTPRVQTSILEGIEQQMAGAGAVTKVLYSPGCEMVPPPKEQYHADQKLYFSESLALTDRADTVVLVLGLSSLLEGEEGDASNSDAAGDRRDLYLPEIQRELFDVVATRAKSQGKPIITVLVNGGPLALGTIAEHSDAIIEAWYPGSEGGEAVADLLFGTFSPSGRLPMTYVHSHTDLPPFEDYSMKGRTYRYLEKPPLYPFGYGLSYTQFSYSDLQCTVTETAGSTSAGSYTATLTGSDTANRNRKVTVRCTITNTGSMAGKEVVQVYVRRELTGADTAGSGRFSGGVETAELTETPRHRTPHWSLKGLASVYLESGASQIVEIALPQSAFAHITKQGKEVIAPGRYIIFCGGTQPDDRSQELTGQQVLSCTVELGA